MMIQPKLVNWIGLILFILLGTVACSTQKNHGSSLVSQPIESYSSQRTIVLGDISDNPKKKFRKFQPLADYLAANLNQFDRGKVKIAPDMQTMVEWLKSGEVDIYIDSPYPAMLAINGADAKPILRRWKKGSAEYYSLIFTMSDRQINSLEDLQGKTVAFDHPFSTTGYMLPLAKLLESGLQPREINSTNANISKNVVGYIFSNEDENSVEWLLSNKVAAAAVDNRTFDQMSSEIKERATILAKTEKIARNLVLVRGNMSPEQIKAISSILVAMDKTDSGKAVLEKFSQTSKFDQFPTQKSLNRMQDLYDQANSQ